MLPFLLKTAIASLTYDAGVCAHSPSCVQFFVTPWTIASQAPLSMEFPRQEHWSGIFVTQGPNSCLLCFLHLPLWQADSLPLSHLGSLKSFITLLLLHIAIAITYYYCNYMLIIITYFLKLHSPVILHITTTGNNIRTTII